ncbi:hypothetical protein [Nocardia noduli]|uniref:hypothetical protein n=1 Tax=Nocardia noduli TaxID=2815722 RepID=UPI001C250081|nr:hypothetical protein [Nocardia noduli]
MRPVTVPSDVLDREDFARHNIPVPAALERATVELVAARSGKWHARNGCQYGREGTVQQIPLLGLQWDEVCRNCGNAARSVDPVHASTLRAVAELSAMHRHIDAFTRTLADPSTDLEWLDYAQWRARCPMSTESIAGWIDRIRGVRGYSRTIAAINTAAVDYSRRHDDLLARLAERLGSDDEDGLLDRAIDIVNTDSPAHAESALLAAITGTADSGIRVYGRPDRSFDAWTSVAALWLAAHRQGHSDPATITADVKRYVAQHLSQVTDLPRLPVDATVSVHPADTPQSWADRMFSRLRDRTVTAWVDRAEMALHGLRGVHRRDESTEPERALLVAGWPLHVQARARLAYLTRYPHLLAPVPIELRHATRLFYDFDDRDRTTVAVLRVPDHAAEQAHAISSHIRSIPLSDDLDPATAARRLLREVGVVVHPLDLAHSPRPSARVETERRRLVTAHRDTEFQYHPRPFGPNNRERPARLHGEDPSPTIWEARAAFDHAGSVFIPGVDDLELFALAFSRTNVHAPSDVQVRLEIAAAKPPTVHSRRGLLPEIEHPPTEQTAGLIDVPAALYGITEDHSAVLLEISPCREPVTVPLTCIAVIQNVRR